MIVDTSAVLAILFVEEDAERYEVALARAENCRMSVANFLETAMVVEGRGGTAAGDELDRLVDRAPIQLVEVTAEQAHIARLAWRRYGKGRHPAGLNFGDCFAYALAEVAQESLLYKGGDFAATDVESA